jgi:YHS domain-containing protein
MRILLYLFDLVVALVVGRVLGAVVQRVMGGSRAQHFGAGQAAQPPPRQTHGGQTARDPVCGMFVSTELSHRLTLHGETLHFCSRECLERYQKEAHA